MSETFGRSDQPWTLPPVPGYSMVKAERGGGDKGGGGMCILYKEALTPHHWGPKVEDRFKYVENERQWLLVDNGSERFAMLHCYVACQSARNDDYLQWNEDLFELMTNELIRLRKQGFIVLCMGDFNSRIGRVSGLEGNTPDLNKNSPMFFNFVTQANLVIMNTLPVARGLFTRFMRGSASVLDYGLIDSDHVNTVTSFVIDEEARYDFGSDHALLLAKLKFGRSNRVEWSFQETVRFNFNSSTDFTAYQNELDDHSNSVPLHVFEDMSVEEKLDHITTSILESGKKTLSLKLKKKRLPKKLPRDLILRIREKNRVSKQAEEAAKNDLDTAEALEAKLVEMKLNIKDTFVSMKLTRRFKLRNKLLLADPCRKKFWRFLKNQVKSAGSISGAYDRTGAMVFQQADIEEAIVDHFSGVFKGQRVPVYSSMEHMDMVSLAIQDIDNILLGSPRGFEENEFEKEVCSPFTLAELSRTLASLPSEKASGYDQIPNELLKNSSEKFRQYILMFLNHIIEDGSVPEAMNLGKCMLIHKVLNKKY